MSYSEMEEKLSSYLGDQYSADDWKDAKTTLFSGKDNVGTCLRHPKLLRQRYMPCRPHPKNMYLHIEANEGDSEEEEEEDGDYDTQDQVDSSAQSPKVMSIPGPSAKDMLSKKIDEIYNNATKVFSSSRSHISYRAAWSPVTLKRTATVYIAEYLHGKGFPVTMSPWLPGQLYMVSDSPKTIASSLPASHKLSVKDYHPISDEEHVAVEHSTIKCPNPLWSGIDTPFVKKSIVVFSKQFLCVGDAVRIITGAVPSEIGMVVSIDHGFGGSTCIKLTLNGHWEELEARLEDVERVFWIRDTVRVVAGSYLGLEGHVIQMDKDLFHLCQGVSMEEEESPQALTLHSMEYYLGPPSFQVPVAFVKQTRLPQTVKFTKEKGYDLKPGDVIRVARGLEYQAKGIVQSVDFPKAHLMLLSESDRSLIDIPIGFVMKILNVSLDSFNVIGQEVFVVRGGRKGFRATLYGIGSENCTVAINGQARTTLKCQDIVTK
ncbi:hypothetical protein BDR06DRAFT_1014772 [Suillus hirtellus]|nr:hypothetical protein BDR06DRAFT_1014772 [Suillus hirtellus]